MTVLIFFISSKIQTNTTSTIIFLLPKNLSTKKITSKNLNTKPYAPFGGFFFIIFMELILERKRDCPQEINIAVLLLSKKLFLTSYSTVRYPLVLRGRGRVFWSLQRDCPIDIHKRFIDILFFKTPCIARVGLLVCS